MAQGLIAFIIALNLKRDKRICILLCILGLYLFYSGNFYLDLKPNLYNTLDISRTMPCAEIPRHFRMLAKNLHPDRNSALDAKENFIRIRQAAEILGDPKKRLLYEAYGILDPDSKIDSIVGLVGWYIPWFMLAVGMVNDRKGGKWVMISLAALAAFEVSRKFKVEELMHGNFNFTISEQCELLKCLFPAMCFYLIYRAGLKKSVRTQDKKRLHYTAAKQQALFLSTIQVLGQKANLLEEEFLETKDACHSLFQKSIKKISSKDQNPPSSAFKSFIRSGLKIGGIVLSIQAMKFIVNSISES